jgi:hypothetical protein
MVATEEVRFQQCGRCVAEKLATCGSYCSLECQKKHWKAHKRWHSEQQSHHERIQRADMLDVDGERDANKRQSKLANGSRYEQLVSQAYVAEKSGDLKLMRKLAKRMVKLDPQAIPGYVTLGESYKLSNDWPGAARAFLMGKEVAEIVGDDSSPLWATAAAAAYQCLSVRECAHVPKPEWVANNASSRAIADRAVAVTNPTDHCDAIFHAFVGYAYSERSSNPSANDLTKAKRAFRRAAELTADPVSKANFAFNADAVEVNRVARMSRM